MAPHLESATVLIGIGSNLAAPGYSSPIATCEAAVEALTAGGWTVEARSRWYRTAPVPRSDQPWFVNGVLRVAPAGSPAAMLARLHEVEAAFGRERRVRNEARVLDLDLLAYGDLVQDGGDGPAVPHPRLHSRAFVLLPLAEAAPGWRHPLLRRTVEELIAALPPGQEIGPA